MDSRSGYGFGSVGADGAAGRERHGVGSDEGGEGRRDGHEAESESGTGKEHVVIVTGIGSRGRLV